MGDALAAIGRKVGLSDKNAAAMGRLRDKEPAQPLSFD